MHARSSRRNFLRTITGAALGAAPLVGAGASRALASQTGPKLTRHGQLAQITYPHGSVSIGYGHHDTFMQRGSYPGAQHIDAMVLETPVTTNYTDDTAEHTLAQTLADPDSMFTDQYPQLLDDMKQHRTPVLCMDVWTKPHVNFSELTTDGQTTLGLSTMLAGASFFCAAAAPRHSFVKGMSIGLGTWLVSPMISYMSMLAAINTPSWATVTTTSAVGNKVITDAWPWHSKIVRGYRNLLIAYKSRWALHHMPDLSHLGLVMGLGHSAIEDDFLRPVDQILHALAEGADEITTVFDPVSCFVINRFTCIPHGLERTDRYEIPELKAIFG